MNQRRLLFGATAAALLLAAPAASAGVISGGTMTSRLDSQMVTAGLRIGTKTSRTVGVKPGAPVSDRTAGGHYLSTSSLTLRAGGERLGLRNVELRISGGKGMLRADIDGERVSVAKMRRARITATPGRIEIADGQLKLTTQGARALRSELGLAVLAPRARLGEISVAVKTAP